MSFQFNCPKCGKLLEAEDSWNGLQTQCPECSQTITIQRTDSTVCPTPQVQPQVSPQAPVQPPPNINVIVNPGGMAPKKPRNRIVYVLLGLLLGGFGVHNFYAGRTTPGIIQLLLTLFCIGTVVVPIWVIVEMFAVTRDGDGVEMESYVPSIILAIVWYLLGFLIMALLLIGLFSGLHSGRERMRSISCISNMKQIGICLRMAANDRNGIFPDTLEELSKKDYLTDKKAFVCPSGSRYIYLGKGVAESSSGNIPLLFEYPGHEKGTLFNVLYSDGHVSSEKLSGIRFPSDVIRALAQKASGTERKKLEKMADLY